MDDSNQKQVNLTNIYHEQQRTLNILMDARAQLQVLLNTKADDYKREEISDKLVVDLPQLTAISHGIRNVSTDVNNLIQLVRTDNIRDLAPMREQVPQEARH